MKKQKKSSLELSRPRKIILSAVFIALMTLASVLVLTRAIHQAPDLTSKGFETRHEVKSGDTLSGILAPYLPRTDIMEIANLLRRGAGVRNLRADADIVRVNGDCKTAPPNKVTIQSGPWRRIEFVRNDEGWSHATVDVERQVRLVLRQGEILDGDSFYLAGLRAGIPSSVLADAYDLLAFEMDFERDVRVGQRFHILYEENFSEGEFVNTGSVVALAFDAGRRGVISMYRFVRSNGRAGYYDENGGGAIKSLKRTPINNARVTSGFSGSRKHPVLGFTRAHRGVDFRAAHGTPIPSAGAGRVVKRGWDNGYGNYVRIRHNASYETLYAHMSRFHPNVKVGTQVRQGQIIGYVGSTGLSTGPHLHYEIIKNGRHVNPMTVKLPAIDNLSGDCKTEFLALRPKIDAAIELMKTHPTMVVYE